jgi:hypothetical protein
MFEGWGTVVATPISIFGVLIGLITFFLSKWSIASASASSDAHSHLLRSLSNQSYYNHGSDKVETCINQWNSKRNK